MSDPNRLRRDLIGFSRYFDQRHERRTERERVTAIFDEWSEAAAAGFAPTPRLSPLAFRVRRLLGVAIRVPVTRAFPDVDREVLAVIAEHRAAEERKRDGLEVLPIG